MPVSIDTTTGPGTLEDIHGAFARFWRSHPQISADIRMHLELAATEIGANIVEHSDAGHPVHLYMAVDANDAQVRVSFVDDGGPFGGDLAAVDMPEALAERGRGLALAIGVLDELRYRRDLANNHWTLVCNRQPC